MKISAQPHPFTDVAPATKGHGLKYAVANEEKELGRPAEAPFMQIPTRWVQACTSLIVVVTQAQ